MLYQLCVIIVIFCASINFHKSHIQGSYFINIFENNWQKKNNKLIFKCGFGSSENECYHAFYFCKQLFVCVCLFIHLKDRMTARERRFLSISSLIKQLQQSRQELSPVSSMDGKSQSSWAAFQHFSSCISSKLNQKHHSRD